MVLGESERSEQQESALQHKYSINDPNAEARLAIAHLALAPRALPDKDEDRLRQLFNEADTDHDGRLDEHELRMVLRSLGRYSGEKEHYALIARIDRKGDSKVELRELIYELRKRPASAASRISPARAASTKTNWKASIAASPAIGADASASVSGNSPSFGAAMAAQSFRQKLSAKPTSFAQGALMNSLEEKLEWAIDEEATACLFDALAEVEAPGSATTEKINSSPASATALATAPTHVTTPPPDGADVLGMKAEALNKILLDDFDISDFKVDNHMFASKRPQGPGYIQLDDLADFLCRPKSAALPRRPY